MIYFIARAGSRSLQSLTPEERAISVNNLADLLITKQSQILEANAKDLEEGTKTGLAKPLLSRLSLTPAKLKSLSTGLKQIADSSLQVCGYFDVVFRYLSNNEIGIPIGLCLFDDNIRSIDFLIQSPTNLIDKWYYYSSNVILWKSFVNFNAFNSIFFNISMQFIHQNMLIHSSC